MDKIEELIGNEDFDNPLLCDDFASFDSADGGISEEATSCDTLLGCDTFTSIGLEISESTLDDISYGLMGDDILEMGDSDCASSISFGSSYTKDEICKLEHDVDMAKSEVNARKSDLSNWESKVSLNDTKEHRENGDYAYAVKRLNQARSDYNYAVDRYNSALSKLNNAK